MSESTTDTKTSEVERRIVTAIIGGGGVRTPLLSAGLAGSDLPLAELRPYDPDRARLAVIAPLADGMAEGVTVTSCDTVEECVEGVDFVFTSFRVGGIESRARNEATALKLGLVGQETVGFGGCAMAVTAVPCVYQYAEMTRMALVRGMCSPNWLHAPLWALRTSAFCGFP